MASSTLDTIRIKVRRLTHSPSPSQLTNTEINEYVNTFYQYDFPEHLRLLTGLVPFIFYTEPGKDLYATNSDTLTPINGLSDFNNRFISIHPPVYVDGRQAKLSQSEGEFYGHYPKNKAVGSTGLTGNGVTLTFVGTVAAIPIQRNSVSFTSINTAGSTLNLIDNGTGTLSGDGAGSINYETGVFGLTFSSAPAASEPIMFHTFPYAASRPSSVLYYSNSFTLRPIPDGVYEVRMQAFKSFTNLIENTDVPELEQWWQYIAYGAAKKVFEDRADLEGVQAIMPEFKKQETLVLRRTLVQQSNERTSTIYDSINNNSSNSWNGNNF